MGVALTELAVTDPVEGYAWTPNAIVLESTQLGPGTFALHDRNADDFGPAGFPLATSGGFVVGEDGVVLIETMINRQLFCQAIDLVREQTDKPVLYAINTSHHGDHSYGNHFLPDEVQVVQHEGTATFIADPAAFAADVAFMEMNFGADQSIDEVEAYAADIVVGDEGWSTDLGGVTVDAHYLGFGQTHGDLFVHVPEADVVFTGNPVVARAPAIPWLLDGNAREVLDTLRTIEGRFPTATFVPGHDAPQSAAVVDFSIDYLERYDQTVIERSVGPLEAPGAGLAEIRALLGFYGSSRARRAAGRGCFLCNRAAELGPHDPSGAGFAKRYFKRGSTRSSGVGHGCAPHHEVAGERACDVRAFPVVRPLARHLLPNGYELRDPGANGLQHSVNARGQHRAVRSHAEDSELVDRSPTR